MLEPQIKSFKHVASPYESDKSRSSNTYAVGSGLRYARPQSAIATNNDSYSISKSRPMSVGPSNSRRKLKEAIDESKYSPSKKLQFQHSNEDLIDEVKDLKKQLANYKNAVIVLRSDNRRMEKELNRLQAHLDHMLETMNNGKISNSVLFEFRKEAEKTSIVRQLKKQIYDLRDSLFNKDVEIENMHKSQKGTNLLTLMYERDEYRAEVIRLQQLAKDLKNELVIERQNQMSHELSLKHAEDSDDLRAQVADLRETLNMLMSSEKESPSKVRNSSPTFQKKSKRPISARKKRIKNSEKNNNTTFEHADKVSLHNTTKVFFWFLVKFRY